MRSKIVALSKNEEFRSLLKEKKISNKFVTIFFGHLIKKDNKKLNILGDGNQKKSYLHIYDCLSAIFKVLKYKLSQWKGKYRGWNLRSSHHYVNHEYHIYDHKENEGYFVLGHDQLCLWLNNTFDCRRYRVFTSYPQLKAYVDNFKGVLDSPAMKFIEEQYGD